MGILLSDKGLLRSGAYINGTWVAADNAETLDVTNPATGEVLARVASCGTAETRRAIEAAQAAQIKWRDTSIKERSAILRRWFNLMMAAQEDLAQILTAEMGKPLAEARGEIAYGASYIEWFAEEGKRIYGDVVPHSTADKRLLCIKQPVGVVACITPWNFPNAMLTRKIAPALAAGVWTGTRRSSSPTCSSAARPTRRRGWALPARTPRCASHSVASAPRPTP